MRKPFIVILLLIISKIYFSQVTMNLDLLGVMTLNGNKYNYNDDTYNFKLQNGFSREIGFDIWFPKK